ncbi:MAG: MarR family transcriptional regulator [Cyclobacteriaceae bacterium]
MGKIDSEIKSNFISDKHRFVTNLVYTANWVQNAFNEELKPFGISAQQYNILRILRGIGDWAPMSEIKDGLTEKSPNTTRLADKLLSKGFVERKASETDRRVVYLKITKVGLALFERINQKDSLVQHALNHNISDDEARRVSDILDQFRR